jgi:hypothetical protein
MPFPRKLLNPEEEIAFELHPHWWYFSGLMGLAVLILVGATVAAYPNLLPQQAQKGLALAVLGTTILGVFWLLARLLIWRTTYFVVTNERVILRQGVLSKHGREILLERIMDLSFHQSLLERMVGTGDLMIESGGESGQDVFEMIPHPELAERQIYAEIEATKRKNAPPEEPGPSPSAPGPSIPSQIAELARLRDQGIVTEAEFQAKKTELLARM